MQAFEFNLKLLGPLINRLIDELSTPAGWWAAGAAVFCLVLAAGLARRIERRLQATGPARLAVEWAHRVAWPLLSLLLLLLARLLLHRFVPVGLLSVGIALMVSLAAVRTLVLMLHQTFRTARWIGAFERTITLVVWGLVALHVLDLLPLVIETLEAVALPLGKSRITLLQAVTGVLTVLLASVLALWAGRAIDARLAGNDAIDPGARAVISRIAQPVLITLALLIALPLIGIDLTTLGVFGGALGVGLGFGMQKIAANYISGFIILLDRSIEPGRLIRVGASRGIVTDIRTRYTVLRGMDGVDSIVPNEMLIGSLVESETFTNTRQRIAVRVGVGYRSDVERAMALMVDAALAQSRVLADPAPLPFLVEFGDSAIVLELGFWIDDPTAGTLALRSDVNLAILRAFREHRIEIPYPQRVVRMEAPAAAG